jgi:hypothetical protein
MCSVVLLALFLATSLTAADDVAMLALNGDDAAIARLRKEGQSGVDRLVALHEAGAVDEQAWRAALDRVCRQRDCAWSHLYWYTDLKSAMAAARKQHRPILSLRLLGDLGEDLSCANSRFFRTILYSNRDIYEYLRANFILHWSSERPVPKVTIDFGDGRVMHRTLTGNSIHYLLDENGVPLDALPGLYSPVAFLGALREMRTLAAAKLPPGQMYAYHVGRATSAQSNKRAARLVTSSTAWDASALTSSKAIVERPMLERVSFGTTPVRVTETVPADPANLGAIDASSLSLIRELRAASPVASMSNDDDFARTVARLEQSIAADTLRNEYELRPKIHQWFAAHGAETFEALNAFVYSTVFMTPAEDRWLGLLPEETFTALRAEGLTIPPK